MRGNVRCLMYDILDSSPINIIILNVLFVLKVYAIVSYKGMMYEKRDF